jgi:hypothetical protein
MSEDLRYYFLDSGDDKSPAIPADEGWKQMQQLLDAYLPKHQTKFARRYFFYILCTILFGILIISSLPLQDHAIQINFNSKITTGDVTADIVRSEENLQAHKKHKKLISGRQQINIEIYGAEKVQTDQMKNKIANYPDTFFKQLLPDVAFIKQNSKDIPIATSIKVIDTTVKNTATVTTIETTNNKKKYAAVKTWQLKAGFGMNISLNADRQALQPYPTGEIKYQFSKKFYVASGFNLFSPVTTNASTIKETVFVNDTASNVSIYKKRLNYKRLRYIDLPVIAGLNINKHFSLQGGIQISKLMSHSDALTLEPYDFQMNRIDGVDIRTLAMAPAAAPIIENPFNVRKTDLRYMAGITFDVQKMSVALQYQVTTKPILKGNAVSLGKNNLLSLKVSYRLK